MMWKGISLSNLKGRGGGYPFLKILFLAMKICGFFYIRKRPMMFKYTDRNSFKKD